MSANQRYLYGDTKKIAAPVHGNVVVEKGDLMFISKTNEAMTGVATADHYAYPATSLADVTAGCYAEQFAGVADKGSISGTTEDIPICTAGTFRFPLENQSGVTVGGIVSGATSSSTAAYDQLVIVKTASTKIVGTTIGKVIKTEAGATNVDFELITRFSGTTTGDIV